ncbi:MAG: urea transporter [Bacteroidia bacterium]
MDLINKHNLKTTAQAVINSYAQMFFSNNRWLAVLLLLASFVDPYTGTSGLIALLASVLAARWLRFNYSYIISGTYTYNSLMVGLALGVYYNFNLQFFVVLVLAAVFTLLVSVWLANVTLKSNTPFLSLPFIAGVWLVLLSTRTYSAIGLSDRGIYTINEIWHYGGEQMVNLYNTIEQIKLPSFVEVYFKSLGAIYFQYNIIAGVLIAIGLLLHSRIAFLLSLVGFMTGYLFYYFLQGNMAEVEYSYIGFNFILSAIAIGGFFLIPSTRSFLLVIISTPLIVLLINAIGGLLAVYQLPMYSLPFTLMVMLLMFTLRLRNAGSQPELVYQQNYSPEKNLYKHLNQKERFQHDTYFHIQLPFYGKWSVSQSHDGKLTHKEDWKYAWDFVVTDDNRRTFRLPGTDVTDFYCYNLPVLAPAAGYIVEALDGIEDNAIGNVNLERNWGNTIIIKHSELLYSKLSHLKEGSFKVKAGDYVKKGELLATCGNSGRSPEPHIHFQLQSTPYIGSKTLLHPISYYISHQADKNIFHSFTHPQENELISRVVTNRLLKDAFNFVPGEIFHIETTDDSKNKILLKWEAGVDAWNNAYLYCHHSKSTAWLVNNETLHYFTDFEGDRNSVLYNFYLAAHKILLGYYEHTEVKDTLPIQGLYSGGLKFVQDVCAPFYVFLKSEYKSTFTAIDDPTHPSFIELHSSVTIRKGSFIKRQIEFELRLSENKLQHLSIKEKGKTKNAQWVG